MKLRVPLLLLLGSLFLLSACKRRIVKEQPSPYDYQNVGKSAKDVLRAMPYSALDIEVQYMPGYKLEGETLDNIRNFLEQVCDKPDGIHINQSEVDLSADTITLDSVMRIEKQHRTAYTGNSTIVIYVLITDGHSDKDGIAAYTYYNTSIVIFGKVISKFASRGKVHMETFLMTHELGHIMGLTNMGTAMRVPHEDSMLIHHCTNPTCAMNQGSTNLELDSLCLRDLKVLREDPLTLPSFR